MTKARIDGFPIYDHHDDEERAKIVRADSAYCENCGHRQPLKGEEKRICRYCGTMVFRNGKIRFKYRLNEKLIRNRREQNGKNND